MQESNSVQNQPRLYWVRSTYYSLNKFLLRVSYHPWAATGINVLGVFTGLFGSLYTKEIKGAFPFQWAFNNGYTIEWEPPVFWAGLVLFSIGFLFRQRAIDNHQKEAHSALIRQTEKLEELVKTVPPANFLYNVQRVYVDCHTASLLTLQTVDLKNEQLEETIRMVIWSMLSLAKNFDEAADGTRYAGNIMIYRDTASIPDEDLAKWEARIKFIEKEYSIKRIKGLLEVRRNLSTCSAKKDQGVDDKLDDFVLPVQESSKSKNQKWRLLPGAPISAYTNKVAIYPETSTLGAWCEEEGDFRPSVITDLNEYFLSPNGRAVQSFVSFPLHAGGLDDSMSNGITPIGVLNIHSEKPGILRGGREDGNHFLPIMEPFLRLLGSLLSEWKRKKTASGKWED